MKEHGRSVGFYTLSKAIVQHLNVVTPASYCRRQQLSAMHKHLQGVLVQD